MATGLGRGGLRQVAQRHSDYWHGTAVEAGDHDLTDLPRTSLTSILQDFDEQVVGVDVKPLAGQAPPTDATRLGGAAKIMDFGSEGLP